MVKEIKTKDNWRAINEQDQIKPSQFEKYDYQEGFIQPLDNKENLFYFRHKAIANYAEGAFIKEELIDEIFSFYVLMKKQKKEMFLITAQGKLADMHYPNYPIEHFFSLFGFKENFKGIQSRLAEIVEDYGNYFPMFSNVPTTSKIYVKEVDLLNKLKEIYPKTKKGELKRNTLINLFAELNDLS